MILNIKYIAQMTFSVNLPYMQKTCITFLLTLMAAFAGAQTQPFTGTKNKKAELLFIQALKSDQFNDTRTSLTNLKKAVEMDTCLINLKAIDSLKLMGYECYDGIIKSNEVPMIIDRDTN